MMASNLAPQPSETSTQLCVVTQGAVSDTSVAGDSFTLTEAHHMRCRERSRQLGYERRGVVCHVMQDLCPAGYFSSACGLRTRAPTKGGNSRQHSAWFHAGFHGKVSRDTSPTPARSCAGPCATVVCAGLQHTRRHRRGWKLVDHSAVSHSKPKHIVLALRLVALALTAKAHAVARIPQARRAADRAIVRLAARPREGEPRAWHEPASGSYLAVRRGGEWAAPARGAHRGRHARDPMARERRAPRR